MLSHNELYIYNIQKRMSKPAYCPCPVFAKKNLPFNGNTVNSSISRALRYSEIVRITGGSNGSARIISNPNASSLASIAPPRNSF